jgi:hypothetical protein
MRGEVQQPGLVAPSYDRYGSGLRDRSADFERSWTLISIPASAAPLAVTWQSAFCTCGFWRKPTSMRHESATPCLSTPSGSELSRTCRKSIDFRTVTLSVNGRVFCADRWETSSHGGSGWRRDVSARSGSDGTILELAIAAYDQTHPDRQY